MFLLERNKTSHSRLGANNHVTQFHLPLQTFLKYNISLNASIKAVFFVFLKGLFAWSIPLSITNALLPLCGA